MKKLFLRLVVYYDPSNNHYWTSTYSYPVDINTKFYYCHHDIEVTDPRK